MSRRSLAVACTLVLIGLIQAAAVTAAPPVEVIPADEPIVAVAESDGAYSGTVRLLTSESRATLSFWTSGLASSANPAVRLAAPKVDSTQDGDVITVSISGAGATVPGTYVGKVYIGAPGDPVAEAIAIDLTVVVEASEVSFVEGQRIDLDLVICGDLTDIECSIATFLLPGSRPTHWPLYVTNDGSDPVELPAPVIRATGEKSGLSLDILSGKPVTVTPPGPATVEVAVAKPTGPADHYVGTAIYPLPRQDALSVPVDVNVRVGPFLPIGVLVLALLAGVVLRWMQGNPTKQETAIKSFEQLRGKILQRPQDDQQALSNRLTELANRIRGGEYGPAAEEANRIASWLGILQQSARVRARLSVWLQGHAGDPQAPQVTQTVDAVELNWTRASDVAADQSAAALAAVSAANTLADSLGADLPAGAGGPVEIAAVPDLPRPWTVRALPALRFVFYVAVLGGLVIAGLNALYVSNPIFGSAALLDYAALAAWGFSSERISGALSQVKSGG